MINTNRRYHQRHYLPEGNIFHFLHLTMKTTKKAPTKVHTKTDAITRPSQVSEDLTSGFGKVNSESTPLPPKRWQKLQFPSSRLPMVKFSKSICCKKDGSGGGGMVSMRSGGGPSSSKKLQEFSQPEPFAAIGGGASVSNCSSIITSPATRVTSTFKQKQQQKI